MDNLGIYNLSDEITGSVTKSDQPDEIKQFILKSLLMEKELLNASQQSINKEYEKLINTFVGE